MNFPRESHALPVPDVIEQAGDWLLRLSEEDLPPDVLSAWLEWYHADAVHRETFHHLQQEYERLKSMPGEQRRAMANQALASLEGDVEPARKVEEQMRSQGLSRRRRWPLALAASLIVALGAGLLHLSMPYPSEAQTGAVQTARGLDQRRTLPDGSILTLGGQSLVSYRYTADARYIVLEAGEAYFEVAKDRQRPFIVHVGGMTVRAVGTAFNIRRSSERVVVTVSEGVVDVQRSEQVASNAATAKPTQPVRVLRLSAGQEVVMSSAQHRGLAVKAADTEAVTAWQKGRFEFVDEPLSAVIATINRYSKREIVITDRELARMTLTGSILRDHIDEWLESLSGIYPAQVSAVGDDTVLISLAAFRDEETSHHAGVDKKSR